VQFLRRLSNALAGPPHIQADDADAYVALNEELREAAQEADGFGRSTRHVRYWGGRGSGGRGAPFPEANISGFEQARTTSDDDPAKPA
jgi:hypothetical protein